MNDCLVQVYNINIYRYEFVSVLAYGQLVNYIRSTETGIY